MSKSFKITIYSILGLFLLIPSVSLFSVSIFSMGYGGSKTPFLISVVIFAAALYCMSAALKIFLALRAEKKGMDTSVISAKKSMTHSVGRFIWILIATFFLFVFIIAVLIAWESSFG